MYRFRLCAWSICNCRILRHGYSMSDLSDKHFYISNRSYRTMPVQHVAAWLLSFLQEETFHYRICSGSGSGNDTGAAGGGNGKKIGVSHSLCGNLYSQCFPFWRIVTPFYKISSGLPVAAFKIMTYGPFSFASSLLAAMEHS